METIEYRNPHAFDKAAWGDGPWQNEPDKKQWQDPATGLPCLIVRACTSGALCGYVGVAQGHPYYGKGYMDINAYVHGGLTFSDKCDNEAPQCEGICHKADAGEDDVWWLGFDCAHGGDVMPRFDADLRKHKMMEFSFSHIYPESTYKNFSYVTCEVESLAAQLKAAA